MSADGVRKAIARVRRLQDESPAGRLVWSDAATELVEALEAWVSTVDPLARAVLDRGPDDRAAVELADRVVLFVEATSKR